MLLFQDIFHVLIVTSRNLHFAIWPLFLLVSFLECRSKCRVNEAEIRIALSLHGSVIYVCLYILHAHREKLRKGVVDYSTDRL